MVLLCTVYVWCVPLSSSAKHWCLRWFHSIISRKKNWAKCILTMSTRTDFKYWARRLVWIRIAFLVLNFFYSFLCFFILFHQKWTFLLFLHSSAFAHAFLQICSRPKLYIPSTLNIDLILWHTQLIVCAENVLCVISWLKSWVLPLILPFTFQAYILPHTLNCNFIFGF